ncbi:MAG: carboxy terminal-processing peptidase [Rehaibacterium terrae]|uniref:carboxy terminal-processing peptidase n=1 Tax=Rehaibacterium terrae TaxID=1341696 RepID=UPI0039193F2B
MFKRLGLLLLVALLPFTMAAQSGPGPSADVGLAPTADQAGAARLVYGLLSDSRYHYKPRPLDDALSAEIHKRYLDALDGERLFFLAEDIQKFDVWRTRLDDAIRAGNLQPAFDIFNVYVQRVGERVAHARALVGKDFDFGKDETWRLDRKDQPWAADRAELDELWRQYVKNDVLRLKLAGRKDEEIRKTLDKRYANLETRIRQLKSEDVFQTFMNAYATAIEPHTGYMTPRTSENFNISMRLSLEGIGAVLQRQDEFIVIRSIVPGGPAAMSGKVKPGDRIVAVGQGRSGPMTDVVGWRVDDVVDLIRGPKDSVVRLELLPAEAGLDGKHEQVAIVRDKIKLEEQAAKRSILTIDTGDGQRRIGVITLPTFYQDFDARRRNDPDYTSATRDVARLLAELKAERVDGVVMDLRNNGGGSLNEAIELTGLFIDSGPVVQVREAGGRVSVESDRSGGVAWDGPLAVLTNRASASASEIFAAAIQDYGRGLIIGEQTFGKGTVQNLIDLDRWPRNETPRFGQVRLTVAQFFRPTGGSTQHKGVLPDIQFPVTLDASEYGESSYDNALPWTKIAPVPHPRLGDFGPLLPLLAERHEARVAEDPEFQWWREDVAEYRAQRARKEISLNIDVRRAERERIEARRRAREEARKALGIDAPSLARSSDDGLQADERDVAADAAAEREEERRPDALLRESAAILADAIELLSRDHQLASRVHAHVQAERRGFAWVD